MSGKYFLLKQVKLNKLTKHVPGHSSRGSTYNDVTTGTGVVEVVDVRGRFGGGLVFIFVIRVLSQQTDPLLQFEVLGINTDGRSQKAAIM